MVTELLSPFKDIAEILPTVIETAHPYHFTLPSNIETSLGSVFLLDTLIQAREGDIALSIDVNIQGVATNLNRRLGVELGASYGETQKPYQKIDIGPFTREVAEQLPTNIGPLVIEWVWQWGPNNTRRYTNIIAGDVGIPFVKVHELNNIINTIAIIEEKLDTEIWVSYEEGTPVICYTVIWALRCPTCLVTEIQVESRRHIDNNLWGAYGDGSADYVEYILPISISALRVPQAVLPTNLVLGDKETFVVGYSPQIHAWYGPEATGTQVIYHTPLIGWKNVIHKWNLNINVGELAFAVQTVSNIQTIKGDTIWLGTNISAPYAVAWESYSTQIIAGFASNLKLATNIWGGHPDDKRVWHGVWEYLNTNIEAEKITTDLGFVSVIEVVAEHTYILGSCGVTVLMAIDTVVWAAKTNIDIIMHTTFDLVDIASYAEISDSILLLTEVIEVFDTFAVATIQHDLFKVETYELYTTFRYSYSLRFFENVEVFPRHFWLNFRKLVHPEDTFEFFGWEFVEKFSDNYEDAEARIHQHSVGIDESFDGEVVEIIVYTDEGGNEFIDVLIDETIDSLDDIDSSL